MKEKRQCLFTKYAFEIGVCTLPAYLVLLAMGLALIEHRAGIAGGLAAAQSIAHGYKEITW
ncbi:MAG: hypothetical protein JW834_02055 [Candidatus Diapherotrites archaeon]|nr:hypothetical protein [Candidatus Diapherotrites archaeon]